MYSIVIVFGSYKCCRMCLQKLLTTAVDSVVTSLMNEVCFVDLCRSATDFIFFPTLSCSSLRIEVRGVELGLRIIRLLFSQVLPWESRPDHKHHVV